MLGKVLEIWSFVQVSAYSVSKFGWSKLHADLVWEFTVLCRFFAGLHVNVYQGCQINALTNHVKELIAILRIITLLKILTQMESSRPQKATSCAKYVVPIIKIGVPVFCTVHPFTQPPNPMLYSAFHRPNSLKSAPYGGATTSLYATCSLDPRDSAFQTASRSIQPFSHDRGSVFLQCSFRRN